MSLLRQSRTRLRLLRHECDATRSSESLCRRLQERIRALHSEPRAEVLRAGDPRALLRRRRRGVIVEADVPEAGGRERGRPLRAVSAHVLQVLLVAGGAGGSSSSASSPVAARLRRALHAHGRVEARALDTLKGGHGGARVAVSLNLRVATAGGSRTLVGGARAATAPGARLRPCTERRKPTQKPLLNGRRDALGVSASRRRQRQRGAQPRRSSVRVASRRQRIRNRMQQPRLIVSRR